MESKHQDRRAFLKPGKYIFPKEVDSDSAFIPRDPKNKF